ncbi:MAG: LysM peptidoglycan-binding domain-containing protein [bacterium]|nr:LysM peptidoglycan-binding domain-containing protein [bacterium]
MVRGFGVFFVLAPLVCFGFVGSAAAQDDTADTEGFATGFHIVRPGENLRRITESYLGSQDLWRRNLDLNPTIVDPDFLLPGQRLQVLLRPEDAVPSAQVVSVSGNVEERPDPIAWTRAQRQDLIVESDGVRTFDQSSTALRFHDGTSLVLTEDSIVFLKVAGRTLRGIETRSVEIVEGQADLARVETGETPPEIEIVIGDARARPKAGPTGASEARLRKSGSGAAQLMIYEGASQVEAGGKSVAVAEGMGTSVPEGAPPLPPEKLLPRAVLSSPARNGSVEVGRLQFSWQPVEGAAGYTVEVCSDAACEALVARAVGLTSTSWAAELLPVGDHQWRVTAVSPSGLDGYPAATQPFTVAPERAEFDPPAATFSISGIAVEPLREGASGTLYAPSARVRAEVEDPSGVASWRPVIDGEPAEKDDLRGRWSHGSHTVTVVAEDELGNRGAEARSLSFAVDAEAPELRWRVGGPELLTETLGKEALELRESRWWLRKAARRNARRARKNRPPLWTLVSWSNERVEGPRTLERRALIRGLYRDYSGVRLTGEAPSVLLLAPGILGAGSPGEAEVGRFLFLQAVDAGAGVEELTVTTTGSPSAGYELRARSRDRLGNASSASWVFSR